jgi:hypothetical protein
MDEPLPAHTLNEVRYYLMVTPCSSCGKGPWVAEDDEMPVRAGQEVALPARCRNCGAERSFAFLCRHELPAHGPEAQTVNPSDAPSRIVDLAQWLSLFYVLIESAATETSKPATRLTGYQAALCLAESLKFYGDNELPPESAFFSPATLGAYREHPEKFAKQRLLDMQAKLPALHAMARNVSRDERARRRRWWQLWRR